MQNNLKVISKAVKAAVSSTSVTMAAKVVGANVKTFPIHPSATVFPDLSAEEFAALKEDIRANGQQQPIFLKDGQVVDGRQRLRACLELAIKPVVLEIAATVNAHQAMVSNNLLRRHLTESQRAMIGAALVTTRVGSNQSTGKAVTQSEAAKLLGISTDTIQRAGKLIANGNGRLMRVVSDGKLTVSEAIPLTALPPDRLNTVLAAANDDTFRYQLRVAKNEARDAKRAPILKAVAEKRANNKPLDSVPGQFGVLYVDPPWNYLPETDTGYPTMSRGELMKLDVGSKAETNSVCFMWVPASQLPLALELMKEWGFEYKTNAVWDKKHPGTGSYFQSRHELLLLGTRGKLPKVAPEDCAQSIFVEQRTTHSTKPEIARSIIEKMYPSLTKLELFRRGDAPEGWAVWGNEAITTMTPEKPPVATTAKYSRGMGRSAKLEVPWKAANERRFRKAA